MQYKDAARSLVTALLVAGLLAPGLAFGQVESEVSEVTGVKRIESSSMRSLYINQYDGSHASFRAAYVNDPDEGTAWNLSFYGFANSETGVSSTNQFIVQADGQQFEPTRLESKTRQLDESIIEVKRATFSRSAFETMATAENFNVRIGSAQFTAIKPRRKDMRLILDRVPDSNSPRTASNDSSDSR